MEAERRKPMICNGNNGVGGGRESRSVVVMAILPVGRRAGVHARAAVGRCGLVGDGGEADGENGGEEGEN